jgi:hypothetical protein
VLTELEIKQRSVTSINCVSNWRDCAMGFVGAETTLFRWVMSSVAGNSVKGAHQQLVKRAVGGGQRSQVGNPSGAAAGGDHADPTRGRLAKQAAASAELETLKRTRRLLEEQVEQMEACMQQITDSDDVIAALTAGVEGVDAEASKNKRMMSAINKVDRADDRFVTFAWVVFLSTLAHVWLERIVGVSFTALIWPL